MKFQACIGPGKLGIVHLRDAEKTKVMNGDLVLCEATSVMMDYRGTLLTYRLCRRCMRRFYEMWPEANLKIDANLIGVRAIIHSNSFEDGARGPLV